jgi:hypothetical protein
MNTVKRASSLLGVPCLGGRETNIDSYLLSELIGSRSVRSLRVIEQYEQARYLRRTTKYCSTWRSVQRLSNTMLYSYTLSGTATRQDITSEDVRPKYACS